MSSNVSAVITGDIVGPTKIIDNYQEILHKISLDIKAYLDDRFILDIYRGDSFQAISNKSEKRLLALLLIKAGLKRHSSKSDRVEMQWDARMSLGIA